MAGARAAGGVVLAPRHRGHRGARAGGGRGAGGVGGEPLARRQIRGEALEGLAGHLDRVILAGHELTCRGSGVQLPHRQARLAVFVKACAVSSGLCRARQPGPPPEA